MKRIRRFAVTLASVLALSPSSARATPVLQALGSPGSAGGLQPVVSSPSAASTYFNPALLEDAPEDVMVGVGLLTEQISVTLDGRRAGADVPLAVGSRGIVGPNGKPIPNDTIPTQWLNQGCSPTQGNQCPTAPFAARPRQTDGSSGQTHAYLLLGGVKHVVKDRVTLGVYMALPLDQLTTAQSFYPDQREQLFSNSLHPELYGDRLTTISIALGASFRVLESLSVGIGTTIGLANTATAQTYVRDPANYESLLVNNDVGVSVALSPHFGLAWKPLSWLRVGANLHAPESFSIGESISSTLPNGVSAGAERTQVHDYLPWRVGLGIEEEVLRERGRTLSFVASFEQFQWSSYVDRHGDSPAVYGKDLGWNDTSVWTFGIRRRTRRWRGFVDLQYAPSPVPRQVGASNYVDNDRLGASIGGDIDLVVRGVHLRPGVSLVGYRLVWRHQTKDDSRIVDEVPDRSRIAATGELLPGSRGLQTNNPGWPGFGSDGWVYGGSFTVDLLF